MLVPRGALTRAVTVVRKLALSAAVRVHLPAETAVTHLQRETDTHTHTHTHVGFAILVGTLIGVMVFVLYRPYILLPYTNPTPKLSPHRRLFAFLHFKINFI